jgi:hypothetical protein
MSSQPRGAHLVGSIPLADASEVFRAASGRLGSHLTRLPDGETGARVDWINGIAAHLRGVPQLQEEIVTTHNGKRPRFRLRAGVRASDVQIPDLGYATAALTSYSEFSRLRASGVIPRHVRFQVSLPTPFAPLHSFVFPENQAALDGPIEARMLSELERILNTIPHEDLAIQWDTAVEFAVLEGLAPSAYADPARAIFERLARWGNQLPGGVELGYHLCYGDHNHRHFIEPKDAGKLVTVANELAARLQRPLQWLHLPVPKQRDDEEYFRPLAELTLRPETELYLGLVHMSDGVAGARRRIQTALQFVPRFGVGTECGFGRRPRETVLPLLDLHAAVAAPRDVRD